MRLRNIPGAEEAVASSPYCSNDPLQRKGLWNEVFHNDHPIRIEIGMGKGQFLMQLAKANPNMNYIGIERYSSVLFRALQKMAMDPLENIQFLCIDATMIADIFGKGEVDRIYLNFSDPWPKERHAKRRLTHRHFFSIYDQILQPGGRVEFKTDNRDLFLFSIEEIKESGWRLIDCTFDLHGDPVLNRGNIMTEYEEKFSARGNPIYMLAADRHR